MHDAINILEIEILRLYFYNTIILVYMVPGEKRISFIAELLFRLCYIKFIWSKVFRTSYFTK